MNDDFDDLEQLLVSEDDKKKYRRRDESINESDIDQNALRETGVSKDDFLRMASERGLQAAKDYIESLRRTSNNTIENEPNSGINLSTKSFISLVTGEEIELVGMNVLDKISTIYYHTGVSVKTDDVVLSSECSRGLYNYTMYLDELDNEQINKYVQRYGSDWRNQLIAIYRDSWNKVMEFNIQQEKDKGAARLRNDLVNEKRINQSLIMQQDVNNSLLQMHRAKDELVKEKETLQTISANLYDFVDPNNNNIHEYIDSKVEEFPPRRH